MIFIVVFDKEKEVTKSTYTKWFCFCKNKQLMHILIYKYIYTYIHIHIGSLGTHIYIYTWVIYELENYFMCLCVYVYSLSVFYNLSKVNIDCFGIKNDFSVNHTSNCSANALLPHKAFLKLHQVLLLNSICVNFMLFKFQLELQTFVYY